MTIEQVVASVLELAEARGLLVKPSL